MSPGEKRRRQAKRARDRSAYEALLAPLKAAGASCGSCDHYAKAPYDKTKHICEIDTDRDGYTVVKADGLCPHWTASDPRFALRRAGMSNDMIRKIDKSLREQTKEYL